MIDNLRARLAELERRRQWLRWLLRYWVMDKYREQLRGVAFYAAVCLTLALGLHLYVDLSRPVAPGEPVKAWINFVIQIALILVSALLSYALAPKPEEPKKNEAKAPEVQDGKSVRKLYGTGWMDDPMVMGWKAMGTSKIKAKQGKKG